MIIGNPLTHNVTIDGVYLDPADSQAIYNHSPDGFAWGYGGSGPAQLALALLIELTNPEFAAKHYQDFKSDIIAGFPADAPLRMPKWQVVRWARRKGYRS